MTAASKLFDLAIKSLKYPLVELQVPLHHQSTLHELENRFGNRFAVGGVVLPVLGVSLEVVVRGHRAVEVERQVRLQPADAGLEEVRFSEHPCCSMIKFRE